MSDPELTEILISEISQKLPVLLAGAGGAANHNEVMRVLHTLRGASGLAGQMELSEAIGRVERLTQPTPRALAQIAHDLLHDACDKLRRGEPAIEDIFPNLPPHMPIRTGELAPEYREEILERLERVDDLLRNHAAADVTLRIESAREIARHLHSIKGAASATGDAAGAWFCHALEDRVGASAPSTEAQANAAFSATLTHRRTLGLVLLEQARFSVADAPARISTSPPPASSLSRTPPKNSVRVEAAELDDVLDRTIALVPSLPSERKRRAGERAFHAELHDVRVTLSEALRIIGPPRPWGTPHAATDRVKRARDRIEVLTSRLTNLSDASFQESNQVRKKADDLQQRLSRLRQTKLRGLFQRIAAVIEVEAARAEVAVRVLTSGADEVIDRKLAEALAEPCMHVARNSVAHGVQSGNERERLGKSRMATISLRAERLGGVLVISIQDDGNGVDLAALRVQLAASATLAPARLDALSDAALLPYVLLPGLSLRGRSDTLAGRGVGLDVAYTEVQRVGGALRLVNHPGAGLTVQLHMPPNADEGALVCLGEDTEEFAVAAHSVFRVRSAADEALPPKLPSAPSLLEILKNRPRKSSPRRLVDLDVSLHEDAPSLLTIAVDSVRWSAGATIRPLPVAIARFGPYRAAAVQPDGSLRMVLDLLQLASIAQRASAVRFAKP